ncbi:MAG: alginate export family protein [Sphingobium sp.]|uniref:alginate export family protein n=1 Tax=Sphingobium sp. TaxID=1912891 RepID=UPI0029A0D145|nr:alginate export family protein [Sphingobium sp.]MDX3910875.1 alginate export family protein [Sphingobium sp.]
MPVRLSCFCALTAVAAIACPAAAQEAEGLKVSGSMRLRYEAISGQARTGFDRKDDLVNLRTQVMAEYNAKPFRFVVEVFDSRVWGDDPGTPVTTGEVNALEPVQAFVAADLGAIFGKGSKASLQAGRFMLNLGSRRLVAADDYRNTTNGYTGLRADVAVPGGMKGTFVYTLPQVRLPDDPASLRDAEVELDRESFDLVLWGGYVSKSWAAKGAASPVMAEVGFFHLGERDAPGRPTRDRSLDTISGRIIAEPKPGQFDYEVEAIYQWGDVSSSLLANAARLPVSATFFHADAGYSFGGGWKPRLSVEFDRASGDGRGRSFGRFDTLFGMRRADLAPAGLYNAIARTNVVTPGVRLEVTPSKRLDAFVTYRGLWLADRRDAFSSTGVRDASGQSGSFAGQQFDARLRYWLIPDRLRFEADAVLLMKGRFLRDAPNAPAGRTTRYGSVNLSVSF